RSRCFGRQHNPFHYSTIPLFLYSTILLRSEERRVGISVTRKVYRSLGPDVSGARCDIELPVSYPPVSCRAVPMSRERHQPKPSKPEPPGVMRFLIVPIPRLRDGAARCDNTTLSTILLFHYSSILLFYLNSDSTSTSSV